MTGVRDIEPSTIRARWLIRFPWLIRSPAAYAVILLLGLALYLPGFTTLPAVDRDESRFAQASRQMLESGDYIDIRLQSEARLKKPVGIYWLQAAATALAGGEDPANPIWTYRLPSLVGALAAIMLTLAIGRKWFGAEAGFIAATLLAVSLLLGFEARQAKTDAVLLVTILVALDGLAHAWIPGDAAPALPRWRQACFWGAIGAGILIKGPIILLAAALTSAALAVRDRRLGWFARLRPWPGILITAAIALPWLIAISIASHGGFLSQSIGADMASKLAGGQESHGAPPGFYLAIFPAAFWPGSLFAVLAAPFVWRSRRDRATAFLLAWLLPSWLAFELIPTKLPHYVLPLYPAVALMAGAAMADRLAHPVVGGWRHALPRVAAALWGVVGIGLGGVVIAAAPLADGRLSIRAIAAGVAIWSATALCGWLVWRGCQRAAAFVAPFAAIAAWALTFGAALPALDAPWIAPRLKNALAQALPDGHGPVISAGYAEPSLLIALGTDTRFGSGSDAAALLAGDARAVAIVGDDQSAPFQAAAAALGIEVAPMGAVAGFNYAKGRRVVLTLFRRK
jgi:4-amino-4-deoxy-L-arabinose transferase-like glycosyltransferase